jgi:hypothetical protein
MPIFWRAYHLTVLTTEQQVTHESDFMALHPKGHNPDILLIMKNSQ